jgi:hypothetical protein
MVRKQDTNTVHMKFTTLVKQTLTNRNHWYIILKLILCCHSDLFVFEVNFFSSQQLSSSTYDILSSPILCYYYDNKVLVLKWCINEYVPKKKERNTFNQPSMNDFKLSKTILMIRRLTCDIYDLWSQKVKWI